LGKEKKKERKSVTVLTMCIREQGTRRKERNREGLLYLAN